ncbi:citrate synthase [Kaistia dalseonensis]|uniref:citrate synthase (unknown stereospecificity) n=1 Tax=Kaistia dalseonensis TaxID=410840 RepID=A0ABU0HDW4_9HYPH|nr:citrate synthase [Kaistia dalseonensis]MCX5497863.1 citrate synthase [Kaistia dalseonensis]MDQ0440507.1 citrate synthase [Kaistia dalseonensis]
MSNGLAGIVAAETVLSDVDGEGGRLILRGYELADLAGRVSYEAAAAVLWEGFVTDAGASALQQAIGAGRAAAYERFAGVAANGFGALEPVEAMRLLLAGIGDSDTLAAPAALVGATGVAAAMAIAASEGRGVSQPDPALPHATDLLRMISGHAPSAAAARAFETYMVTVIDHGLNASTFAARVVASTGAGLTSSLVAALSALKGPLHGGAPGPVLDMLDAIGAPENAEAWMEAALARGERIMGFGHRAYRVRDPRADVLRAALTEMGGGAGRLDQARQIEAAALAVLKRRKSGRRLDVNVEFYTALLLDALDIPRSGFTPVFAAARAAGWIAHVLEQQKTGRIIRPDSRYVGPEPLAKAG